MARPERSSMLLAAALLLASHGHADVPVEVKQALRTGDFAVAQRLLAPLAEDGDADALYELGRMRQRGLGVAADPAGALDCYRRAAELGHVESAYLLGTAYASGRAVEADAAQARRWLIAASEAGHRRAALKLEQLASGGAAGGADAATAEIDPPEAFRRAVQACEAGRLAAFCGRGAPPGDVPPAVVDSALPAAVDCENEQLLEMLLACGADLSAADSTGNTALHRAVAAHHHDSARLLLKRGSSDSVANAAGWSPRMLAERSNDERMRRLFRLPEPASAASLEMLEAATRTSAHRGWSPLAVAAWRGELEIVADLLESGVAADTVDASGRSALARAVSQGHVEIAQKLLVAGATADAEDLAAATEAGLSSLLEPLVAGGADVAPPADDRPSPLYLAVQHDQPEVAGELLRLGADPNLGYRGSAPMMLAAREGRGDMVARLFEAGASVHATDASGCSALCWALRSGQRALALELIDAGAPDSADQLGETTAMLAAQAGFLDGVASLVSRGGQDVLNAQSASGAHALMLAAANGHDDVVGYLLGAGAQVALADNVGDTALIVAVRNDHKPVAALLLRHGANAHARNERFESARSLAESKGLGWSDVFDEESALWRLVSGGR